MKLIKNSKKYQIVEMLWEMIRSRFLEDNGMTIILKTYADWGMKSSIQM